MDIQRTQQSTQKNSQELGVVARDVFRQLLEVGKGEASLEAGQWFYKLCMDPRYSGTARDIEEARELLRAAWWIEKDDIQQQLLMIVFRDKNYLRAWTKQGGGLRCALGRQLRDWLITQRTFSRQTQWESDYKYLQEIEEEPDSTLGLPIIFNDSGPFSLFERYLLYISILLGLPLARVSDIMLTQQRQINRFTAVLKNKLEELNAGTT